MSERFTRDHTKRKRDEHVKRAEELLARADALADYQFAYRAAWSAQSAAHSSLASYYDGLLNNA